MGLMSLQTDDGWAYFWRVFGIAGTFMFMMFVQTCMCVIADIPKQLQIALNGISYLGVFVFFLYIQPGQTIFVRNAIGTTFYFRQRIINDLYSLYYILVSINLLAVTLYMVFKHKLKRVRSAGKRFLVVEFFIFFGAIWDMLVPSFGKPALPGSAITQFWGVFVFWFAIHEMYRAHVTVANMSEYIYFSLDIPVLVFDSKGKLRVMNGASSKFFGIEEYELNQNDYVIKDLFDINEDVFSFEGKSRVINSKAKMSQHCQLAISKIDDKFSDTVGYILIVNDLSEHYLAMKRLEDAKRSADDANMSKSLFLANMSHEIRTPMNAILGFSEMALKESFDSTANEYFEDIKQAGETLLAIINDILDISRLELGKTELTLANYQTAQLFNDVSLIIGMQAQKKNLKFAINIDGDYPKELLGDRDRIREILINLLNNAVKYTKTGGIKFEAKVVKRDADEVTVSFIVSDTGIGIKKEDIESIFEIFKRTDAKLNSQTEGTGLGLSITKNLVELMNGTIKVDSTYGVGSAFTVEITQKIVDAAPIALEKIKREPEKIEEKSYENVKVLAVDDNKVNLKVLSKILDRYKIPHDTALSGQESIDLCKENKYDLIFMDQMMPVMDGI